jgi:S-adenosylmethionine decarboxylase
MQEYDIRGKLCTADMYGVNRLLLDSEQYLIEQLIEAAKISGATVLKEQSVKFKPTGVTVACILSESHITCHTYPDRGFIAVDCYTCGEHCDPEKAIEYLALVLCPSDGMDKEVIIRGKRT